MCTHPSGSLTTTFPTPSQYNPAGLLPSLGTQISISRQHATVLISFMRYQPFLLVNPPSGLFSDVRWDFGPLGCIPSSLVTNSSRKAVPAWWVRSFAASSPGLLRVGFILQMIQSFSPLMSVFAVSCSWHHTVPNHHYRTLVVTTEDRGRRFPTVSD